MRRNATQFTCRKCGSSFWVAPSQIQSGSHGGYYCSRACYHAVKFSRTITERLADFTAKSADDNGCWTFTGYITADGYGAMGANRKSRHAHAIAFELAIGRPLERGEYTLHTCDNRACVRNDGPEGVYVVNGVSFRRFGHLWLGDNDANMADMDAKGRRARLFGDANPIRRNPDSSLKGEESPNAKLTEADVRFIRTQCGVVGGRTLAKQYGVSYGLIFHIWKRRAWTHVS